MDTTKYANICVDYEELMKKDCEKITEKNKIHCDQVKQLLENCYQFKEKKSKKN